MQCPFCGNEQTKVLESRTKNDEPCIRRRRECESCKRRFTTYERIEIVPVQIIKRNGSREEYNQQKLLKSILKCCDRCEMPTDQVYEIADQIECELNHSGKKEITSIEIGERILDALKKINTIAYLRYLLIFRHFSSVDEVIAEINANKNSFIAI